MKQDRRVVITGLSVICAIGHNAEEFWKNCLEGCTKVEDIPEHWHQYAHYNSTIWSTLPDVDFDAVGIKRIDRIQHDKVSLLVVCSLQEALSHAGYTLMLNDERANSYHVLGLDPERTGIFVGTASFGVKSFLEDYSYHLLNKSKRELADTVARVCTSANKREFEQILERFTYPRRFSPFAVSRMMPNAMGALAGIRFSITGPNNTYALACAAGTASVGHAFRAVRAGYVDVALAGGCDYWDDYYGGVFRGFDVANTLASSREPKEEANRPFDKDHSGFLFSQGGAAMLVLEEYDAAITRGAQPIAEIKGYAETFDAHSMMSLAPNGEQVERMISLALSDAGLAPQHIDYINAHGTGTRLNDKIECEVIDRVFGRKVFVNSTKSLVGHTFGASGAIEAVVTALSLRHGTTHKCLNLDNPIMPLNFVTEVNSQAFSDALTQSFSFGGHNAGLVLSKIEDLGNKIPT